MRGPYQRQTRSGSRRKASIEATSIESTSAHSPLDERKSGMPLSVLIPAPVSTTAGPRSRISAASSEEVPTRAIVGARYISPTTVDGYSFSHDVRVRFAETDAQGIAHHASFVVWLEVARVAYLAEFAGGYQSIRDRGIEALTTAIHVEYGRAAVFDDELRVWVRCGEIRGARFRYDYVVERASERVASGWTMHATVDAATRRPIRVPDWFVADVTSAEGRSGLAQPS